MLGWAVLPRTEDGREVRRSVTDRDKDGIPEQTKTEWYVDGTRVRREILGDPNEDGVPDAWALSLYQNGDEVYCQLRGPRGDLQHSFFRDGDHILAITDEDGDGRLDWAIIYDEDELPYAVLHFVGERQVEIAGARDLQEARKGAAIGEAFGEWIKKHFRKKNAEK